MIPFINYSLPFGFVIGSCLLGKQLIKVNYIVCAYRKGREVMSKWI